MITAKEAAKIFLTENPNESIAGMYDFGDNYLIYLETDENFVDYDTDGFYIVNKKTGTIDFLWIDQYFNVFDAGLIGDKNLLEEEA